VEPLAATLSSAGIGVLAVAAVLLGLFAGAAAVALGAGPASGGAAWLGLGLTVAAAAAGFGLWQMEALARSGAAIAARSLTLLARLEWLYRVVWGALGLAGTAARQTAEVLEGEGALLWALVFGLLLWLAIR
jgi:hypothetical protein